MKKINHKSILITLCSIFLATFGLWQIGSNVFAEQSGSTPDSGSTSRIKTIYDSLVSLSHGSDSAGAWGDWGSYWNRIRSAGEWVPTGDATEADVATGKLFYSDDRTQKTGSASLAPDYSTQSLATKDDYVGTYQAEESSWIEVSGSPFTGYGDLGLISGKVKEDVLTGLWWSASSTNTISNDFSLDDDGVRPSGGDAIAFCDALSSANYGGRTGWYLPTHKELLQAYINGIYSQDSEFADTVEFWSSTQTPYAPWAYRVTLHQGMVYNGAKTAYFNVHCVSRI